MEGEYPYRNHWINEAAADLLSYPSRVSVDLTPTLGSEKIPMAVETLTIEEMVEEKSGNRASLLEEIFVLIDTQPRYWLGILERSLPEDDLLSDRREFSDLLLLTLTGYSFSESEDTDSDPVDIITPEMVEILEEVFGDELEDDDRGQA